MGKFATICLFIFCYKLAFTQVIGFSKTEPVKLNGNEEPKNLIKHESGSYYLHTGPKMSGMIAQKQWIRSISKGSDDEKKLIESNFKNATGYDFFEIDKRIYRVILVQNKKANVLNRKIIEYDSNAKVISTKEVGSFNYSDKISMIDQQVRFSSDSSHILIIDWVDFNLKKKDYFANLTILNRNLEIVNNASYRPSREDSQRLTDLHSFRISNTGTAYLLHKVFGEKPKEEIKKNKKSIPNYKMVVSEIPIGEKENEYILDTGNNFVFASNLYLFEDGTPYVVTTNQEKYDKNGEIIGMSTFTFKNGNFQTTNKIFNSAERKEFAIGTKSKYRKEGDHLHLLKDAISIGEVSHFIMSRQYIHTKVSTSVKGGTVESQLFINESFILFTIDKTGLIIDHKYVPRFYGEYYFNPPIIKKIGNIFYAVYLDYKSNLENSLSGFKNYPKKLTGLGSRKAKTTIVVAQITDEEIKRDYLTFKTKSKGLNISPRLSLNLDDKTLVFCVEDGAKSLKKNLLTFITLKFK